jgi:hypothetical protein
MSFAGVGIKMVSTSHHGRKYLGDEVVENAHSFGIDLFCTCFLMEVLVFTCPL